MTTLPHFKSELTGEEDLPERLLKGKRAYEQWATCGGTVTVESVFPYDSLSDLDRQRWVFFAKAYGDPTHQHAFAVKEPRDVERFPELVDAPAMGMFEHDEALTPSSTIAKPIPAEETFYRIWVDQQQAKLRKHWWQFRRPTQIDTSLEAYREQFARYQELMRRAAIKTLAELTRELYTLKQGDRLIDHLNAKADRDYQERLNDHS